MNSEAEIIEEELVYGARRRELIPVAPQRPPQVQPTQDAQLAARGSIE